MDIAKSLFARCDRLPSLDDFNQLGWVWMILVVFIFAACIQLVYSLRVIFTLAIVEASPSISLPLNSGSRKAVHVLGIESKPQFTTSSICGTWKHLRAQAGVLSAWRGIGASIAYVIAISFFKSMFNGVLGEVMPEFIARPIASVISALLLARFSLVITHIIISQPQPKWWFKRVMAMPWSSARQTLPALAHFTLADSLVNELLAFTRTAELELEYIVAIYLLGFFLATVVVMPLWVGLVRVQASLLPENEEAIVNFDRSFGKEDGGALEFKEAIRSVKCSGWQRLGKLMLKMVGAMVGLIVLIGFIQFALINVGLFVAERLA